MKDLKQFILEAQKHVDTATVGDFYQWACAGEMPNGKAEPSMINPDECVGLFDNDWLGTSNDEPKVGCKKIADWFKQNWDKTIKVTSENGALGGWEISFKLDGKEYVAPFEIYFGGKVNEY